MTTQKDIISTEFPRAKKMSRLDKELAEMKDYLTNPNHGGKVTCYKCGKFIIEGDEVGYWDHQHKTEFPAYHFHKLCYNHYEHYYGIDNQID